MTQQSPPGRVADRRFEVIARRDRSFEGEFVYAVVTTGVYCRPWCPSRRPRPENVRFFETGEAAKQAGFRPCKRCKPDERSPALQQSEAISKACALIADAEEAPDFAAIAKAAGMSRHHFHRVFKTMTGLTPGGYSKALKERRVIEELGNGGTVTEAIYGAGYSSSSRFYETVAPKLGLKPSVLAKGGIGEAIWFAIGECSLGTLLVAATAKGVCAIELGDSPEQMIESFQKRFPKAHLIGGDSEFERVVAEVAAVVDEPRRKLELPLHVRGTAFQHKLWQALQTIAPGETKSYTEMATLIGNPSAVRAVANACGANKLAVAIPCHRVVRNDGSISGYRWGVERKRALLDRETKE
jgi:AraC family transcriptional regulator of adaptative response/methylated-DNA-[protein]-cysteine methyltransferase